MWGRLIDSAPAACAPDRASRFGGSLLSETDQAGSSPSPSRFALSPCASARSSSAKVATQTRRMPGARKTDGIVRRVQRIGPLNSAATGGRQSVNRWSRRSQRPARGPAFALVRQDDSEGSCSRQAGVCGARAGKASEDEAWSPARLVVELSIAGWGTISSTRRARRCSGGSRRPAATHVIETAEARCARGLAGGVSGSASALEKMVGRGQQRGGFLGSSRRSETSRSQPFSTYIHARRPPPHSA